MASKKQNVRKNIHQQKKNARKGAKVDLISDEALTTTLDITEQ